MFFVLIVVKFCNFICGKNVVCMLDFYFFNILCCVCCLDLILNVYGDCLGK